MLIEGLVVGSLIWEKDGVNLAEPHERGIFTNYQHGYKPTWFSDRAAMMDWIEETRPDHILVKSGDDPNYESWDVVQLNEVLIKGVSHAKK